MDFNKTGIVHEPISSTGAGTVARISSPSDFLIKKAWLVVRVQGAESTRKVRITNVGGGTTIAELSPGTAAVGTVFSVSVEEDKRAQSGGVALEIATVASDASAVYDLYYLVSHSE